MIILTHFEFVQFIYPSVFHSRPISAHRSLFQRIKCFILYNTFINLTVKPLIPSLFSFYIEAIIKVEPI